MTKSTYRAASIYRIGIAIGFVMCLSPVAWGEGAALKPDLAKLAEADALIDAAVAQGQMPGAVLCVGTDQGIIYQKAFGHRSVKPTTQPMTVDTIFDLASLSKPVGTSTSAMILLDEGKLSLSARVGTYLPAFANHGKEAITIEQLLLHQGGLIPDNPIEDFKDGGAAGIAAIMRSTPKFAPGTHFVYSDVGFMTLGEVVKKVAGRPLDEFAKERIFEPLGMRDTMYNPPEALRSRMAPTEQRAGHWMVGEVHDPRAYALGGVAGHAGLFSTTADLSRWCRMILNRGELEGTRVMSQEAVETWTTPHYLPDGTNGRTYGFDVDTAYSSPRGERFEKGATFGHTGFTGTSVWIDPKNRCFVILLTNSVHPEGKGKVIALRRVVGTAVAEALLGPVGK